MSTSARPIWVGELELANPSRVGSVGPQTHVRYERARILIRLHGSPLGFVELPLHDGQIDPQTVEQVASAELGGAIRHHLERDGLSPAPEATFEGLGDRSTCRDVTETVWCEPFTVVVCTRDRPAHLAACLTLLQQLRYHSFEVVVVDNAPSSDASADCFQRIAGEDPRFRYVKELKPGLSRARNRGLAEAAHAYVAFTDDDVLVDAWWLDGLARGFSRDAGAGCVTGFIPSAQLDTPFQQYFDQRVWWSSRLVPHVYDLADRGGESPMFPFDAGKLGTGANFAIERKLIESVGGFDEGLGAGSPTRGGEDLDAFVRVLRAGRKIVYEPSAVVWHIHRAAFEELRQHLYGYGMGLSAYLTKYLCDPSSRRQMLQRVPSGVIHMISLWRRADAGDGSQVSLILAEARGLAAGPLAYRRARRSGWPEPG